VAVRKALRDAEVLAQNLLVLVAIVAKTANILSKLIA